jgi:hypothetical protein
MHANLFFEEEYGLQHHPATSPEVFAWYNWLQICFCQTGSARLNPVTNSTVSQLFYGLIGGDPKSKPN